MLDPVPVHLDEHAVTFCGEPGLVHHLDVRFVAVAPAGAVPVVSEESTDVRWWPVDALPEPDTGLVARSLRAGCSQPPRHGLDVAISWPGGGSTLAAADQPSR